MAATFRITVHEEVRCDRVKEVTAATREEAEELAAADDWRTWEIDEDTHHSDTYISSVERIGRAAKAVR